MKYAFRCKSCGHLHHAEHAGDTALPHACCVCGRGVQHGPDHNKIAAELRDTTLTTEERLALAVEYLDNPPDLTKKYQPDNWEVLADCTPERLEELGLTKDDVIRHHGSAKYPDGKSVFVHTESSEAQIADAVR